MQYRRSRTVSNKTQYRLKCGIAHCSKQLGVHTFARLNFSHQSPGDSYKILKVDRTDIHDNGECMYNVIGRSVYGENMQPRVRKECNDWIEENMMLIPQGPVDVAAEKVPIPVSFLPELLSRREIWDKRTDEEIKEYIQIMSQSAEDGGKKVWGTDLECMVAAYRYGTIVEFWYPNLETGTIRCVEYSPPESFLKKNFKPIIMLHDGRCHVHMGTRQDENGKQIPSEAS